MFWKGCGGMCSGEELSTLGFREGIALLREVTFGLCASQIQLQQCQEGTAPGGGWVRVSLLPRVWGYRAFPCGCPRDLPFL